MPRPLFVLVAGVGLEPTAYGIISALDPLRIFSKADTTEQINVRIDDKLSQIARGTTPERTQL